MTLDIFWAHKEGITQAMKSALIMSKALNKPMHDYCEYKDYITISFDKGKVEDINEAMDKLQRVQSLIDDGYTLKIDGETYADGRYDYFHRADFKLSKKLLRDKIEDTQIEDAMRALLKKEMGLGLYKEIECKVIALYKEGKIEWEDVVKAHTTNCKM